MTTLVKIIIAEAITIIILAVILLWPVEKVSMDEYDQAKKKAAHERSLRVAIQGANEAASIKWKAQEAALKEKIEQLESTKTTNNEKMDIDVGHIRDVSLDTLIRTRFHRPDNY